MGRDLCPKDHVKPSVAPFQSPVFRQVRRDRSIARTRTGAQAFGARNVRFTRLRVPVQDYKNIKAWAKGHALLLNVHRVVRRFPRAYSNLRSQMQRAAESIPNNIVEGSACVSNKEFAKYVQHSINSCSELEYQLMVARDYGLLHQRQWSALTSDVCEVRMMCWGFKKRLLEG